MRRRRRRCRRIRPSPRTRSADDRPGRSRCTTRGRGPCRRGPIRDTRSAAGWAILLVEGSRNSVSGLPFAPVTGCRLGVRTCTRSRAACAVPVLPAMLAACEQVVAFHQALAGARPAVDDAEHPVAGRRQRGRGMCRSTRSGPSGMRRAASRARDRPSDRSSVGRTQMPPRAIVAATLAIWIGVAARPPARCRRTSRPARRSSAGRGYDRRKPPAPSAMPMPGGSAQPEPPEPFGQPVDPQPVRDSLEDRRCSSAPGHRRT